MNKRYKFHDNIPYTDLFPKVRKYIIDKWKQRWRDQGGRKLKEIMPELERTPLYGMTRKEEVVFHRVRIGHTRLTHSYLMEGQRVEPVCHFCNDDQLTIKHLLLNCVHFNQYRMEDLFVHGGVTSMKDLFDKVPFRKIIDFLKHTGLFNEI